MKWSPRDDYDYDFGHTHMNTVRNVRNIRNTGNVKNVKNVKNNKVCL